METPILQKRLLELLPSNIQLLYGIIKSGGASINGDTVTINTPYQFSKAELEQQRDAVRTYQDQYLREIQQQDSTATIPANETAMFADIIKVYEVVLQQLG
jgi:hypothetical protein